MTWAHRNEGQLFGVVVLEVFFSIRSTWNRRAMVDSEKPRRPSAEAWAEIADLEAQKHADADAIWSRTQSLSGLVAEMEEREEADYRARERAETAQEKEESRRLLEVEAEIEAEIPVLHARELRRTFSLPARAYAATASD